MATYRTIFATSRNKRRDDTAFMPDGMVQYVYSRDVSGVAASGVGGLVFWFLYVKEESPSTMPNCPRYSEEDAKATIDRYGHLKFGPGYTFLDLWEARVRSAMVPLEEGVVEGSWNSGGRVVLMGDSVAKVSHAGPAHLILMCDHYRRDAEMLTCSWTGNCKPGTQRQHTC